MSDPPLALEQARGHLAGELAPPARSIVERAAGNAHRELRQIDESRAALRRSSEAARTARDRRLEGLALMSLAATESYTGEFEVAFELIEAATRRLEGDDLLLALNQRAGLLQRAGRSEEAAEAFHHALELAPTSGIPWIAGSLHSNRGVLRGYAGEIEAAVDDTQRALEIFEAEGWDKRAADMVHNLAWLAGRGGDVVAALRLFDEAQDRYDRLGLPSSSISPDRCEVLLVAGLHHEALQLATHAVTSMRAGGDAVDLAEALVLQARAALAGGDAATARSAADEAAASFAAARRRGWAGTAIGISLDAEVTAGTVERHHLDRAVACADELRRAGLVAAANEAAVIAADIAVRLPDLDQVDAILGEIEATVLDAARRARLSEVRARRALLLGEPTAALATCETALDEAAVEVAMLGGTELRRLVGGRVRALATLGLRILSTSGDGREILGWAERSRAASLAFPPIRPPEDRRFAERLDRLRAALASLAALDSGEAEGSPEQLRAECAALQHDVAAHARLAAGADPTIRPFDVDALHGALAGDVFVELIELEGGLLRITVGDGEIRVDSLGDARPIERAAAFLRAALARVLRQPDVAAAHDLLLHAADELDELLPWRDGAPGAPAGTSFVICPTGSLQATPWAVLPSLRDRAFSVAPSARTLIAARAASALGDGDLLLAGPELAYADAEVAAVAAVLPNATSIDAANATSGRFTELSPGRRCLHLACHGVFSAEHPMFSHLRLADGPLFLYDIERLERPPSLVVLSACHGGLSAASPGEELLGFTSSLLSAGVANVVASPLAVPDRSAIVDVMTTFHTAVRAGQRVSDALMSARRKDPVVAGTFLCVGAG